MTIVRPLPIVCVIAALAVPYAFSQEKPAAPAPQGPESLTALLKEYKDSRAAWTAERREALEQAKKSGKEQGFKFDKPIPNAEFSPRFLAIAERNPEAPEAIDALKMALQTSNGPRYDTALETRAGAVKLLQAHYVTKPQIRNVIKTLTRYDDKESCALVADVIARNPDREIQMAAYKGQIVSSEMWIRFTETIKDPARLESITKAEGEDYVKWRLAKAEKARSELDGLKQTLREKYGDLVNDLSIGRAAPEIKLQDVDGKGVTLSALKGKVVVLDIWATWCAPCKAMIPHEREMVGRLEGKAFAMVSLSIDDEVKTLKDFLAKESMPWTHWWAGPGGWESRFAESWEIHSIPAVFVLDAKGVIRFKGVRGEELEKAVNELLKESDVKAE